MAGEVAKIEDSPLRKFDEGILKNIGSREVDAGAPRALFLPANMAEAMEVAKLMAAGNFVPGHLRGRAGDCLAVVMQATRWGMDPFAVGNKTYFVNDRMAYEAQLVNAVINSAHVLDGRLHPEWSGEGNELVCTVTGRIKGDPEPKVRRVPIKNISTRNSPLWKQDPEQQLAYYAMRAWTRLHAPEVLLGVYTPDEVEGVRRYEERNDTNAAALTGGMLLAQAAPQTLAEELGDEIPRFDSETGEIVEQAEPARDAATGMTQVDEDIARQLDAETGDGTSEQGGDEPDSLTRIFDQTLAKIAAANTGRGLKAVETEWTSQFRDLFGDDQAKTVDDAIAARREAMSTAAG